MNQDDLFYEGGDANEGVDPNIIANAYTNAIPMPTTTLQYGIDGETDSLVTIGTNAGTLTTLGKLYLDGDLLDVGSDGGLDILSFAEGDNHAFALFISAATSGSGLFSIDLDPDAMGRVNATLIGSTGRLLDGLAVAPAPVPVPAAALLLGTALGGLRLLRRRP